MLKNVHLLVKELLLEGGEITLQMPRTYVEL